MKKIVVSIILLNLLAACASQKTSAPIVEAPVPSAPAAATEAVAPAAVTAPASVMKTEVDPLNDPASILAKRSVYYPFDVSVVQDSDKPIVQAHAKYLNEHANRKIRLEGNCDERGSNEYNLALGQRRADGVKKMLQLGGVRDIQMESMSYGEEKPKASGHDEASWAQNRRTDLNYAK